MARIRRRLGRTSGARTSWRPGAARAHPNDPTRRDRPTRWTLAWARSSLAVALLLAACGSEGPAGPGVDGPLDLALPWRTATPDALGMDGARLARAADEADDIPRVQSLLVVRSGRIVLERYYDGFARDSLADVRSVTKSIVATLVGIALERGDLPGLDATLAQLLPADVATLSEDQRAITLEHLLTMTGGWHWEESGGTDYNDWILSGNHLGFLLARPLTSVPGATFTYNSAAVHLLGVVLEEAVGPLPDYARTHLFGPLGFGEVRWEAFPENRVNGGAGIDLLSRDLARFGQLMLQEGVSGGRQVVPAAFVDAAASRRLSWEATLGPTRMSYGYLWWTDEANDAFFAWGHGGQFVYVAPARDLVVVTTTRWRHREGEPRVNVALELLAHVLTEILPAAPPV